MTLIDFVQKALEAIENGQNPDAELLVWDPEIDAWSPVKGITPGPFRAFIYSDDE